MNADTKLKMLQKLIDKSTEIVRKDSSDPVFKTWKDLCERTLSKIFGEQSREVKQFSCLKFYYNPSIWVMGNDYSREHYECFNRDFSTAIGNIKMLIEEMTEFPDTDDSATTLVSSEYEKIFISHSSDDKTIVEELIDIIETIGIPSSKIFCSSFQGYGVPLGDDFLKTIKDEISKNVLVVFVLSKNFYASPVCLCEMGATWALSNEQIPILIPPFRFSDIKGVFPLAQGMLINDELSINLLHDKIISLFGLDAQQQSTWERKRDRIVKRINEKIGA